MSHIKHADIKFRGEISPIILPVFANFEGQNELRITIIANFPDAKPVDKINIKEGVIYINGELNPLPGEGQFTEKFGDFSNQFLRQKKNLEIGTMTQWLSLQIINIQEESLILIAQKY